MGSCENLYYGGRKTSGSVSARTTGRTGSDSGPRERERAVARARSCAARQPEVGFAGVAIARRALRSARWKAGGCRAAEVCREARRGAVSVYAQWSASCPWSSIRASSWAGSSFSSCERPARQSGREGVSGRTCGARVVGGDGKTEGGVRSRAPPAGRSAGVSKISPHAHFLALRRGLHHVRLEVRLPLHGILHLAGEEPSEPPHGVSNGSHRARARNNGGMARC